MTLNSEEVRPVAVAIIKLHLSEDINKSVGRSVGRSVSQSVSQSVRYKPDVYVKGSTSVKGWEIGIRKLHTTAYHPKCDGMVEHFNCTLKTALWKHVETYGSQWDDVWMAYCLLIKKNSTWLHGASIIISFLIWTVEPLPRLFCWNLLLCNQETGKNSLFQLVQHKGLQQKLCNRPNSVTKPHMIARHHFPCQWQGYGEISADKTGILSKLSHPWHGPYRISALSGPDVSVSKYIAHRMEEFKFISHVSSLAPLTFYQGFIVTGERGEDQVVPLNGWNKFLLLINQLNETTNTEDDRTSLRRHKWSTLGNTKHCHRQWTITGANSTEENN